MRAKIFLSAFCTCFLVFFGNSQELDVYTIQLFERNEMETVFFTSFSDTYGASEDPDSAVIPDQEGKTFAEASYVVLDGEYRSRFLDGTGLSEADNLFIYDYESDKLVTLNVKDLKVVACINAYAGKDDFPFLDDDYQIGFELDKNQLSGFSSIYYSTALVCAGKENPFEKGKMEALHWVKCDPATLNSTVSSALRNALISEGYKNFREGEIHSAISGGFQFFVQKMMVREYGEDRQVEELVVVDQKLGEIVCRRLFFEDEGSSNAPLNGSRPEYNDVLQWAGRLFKNRPPVVFGFSFYSFSCPEISFLQKDLEDIYLKCDSRH